MLNPETREWAQFEQVVRATWPHGRLQRAWRLVGGISAQVTALAVELPDGKTVKAVIRQHGEADRARDPLIAASEFRLLQLLHAVGLAVPRPYCLDASCALLSTPYIVLEYIEGEPEFAPADRRQFLSDLAHQLAAIHRLDCANADLTFLPKQEQTISARLDQPPGDAAELERIRAALAPNWPRPQRNRPVLLHGDFWPGNVLWKDGRLAAVIDWEDAATGDPLSDLANARLEILWLFGPNAMDTFTRLYQTSTTVDLADLPYWDLSAALRLGGRFAEWAVAPEAERAMRERYSWFVDRALARLGQPCLTE